MTEITIPRESLEAAARAIYNLCPITDEYDDVRAWDDLDATEQEAFWDEARAALEGKP